MRYCVAASINNETVSQKMALKVNNAFKFILMVTIYLGLILFFWRYFLLDATNNFIEGKTTMSTRSYQVDSLEFPTVTICPSPGFNPIKMTALGLDNEKYFWTNSNKIPSNISIWALYENLSFIANRDFHLKFESIRGTPNEYNYSEIATVKGMCYQLTSHAKISDMGSYNDIIGLELSTTKISGGINSLLIYLTSNQSWHGVVDDYWPLNDPSVFEVAKGKASLVYLKQTENDYKTGNADVNKCLTKAIETTNCTKKCFPVIYNFLNETLHACESMDEVNCIVEKSHMKQYRQCYLTKRSTQYKIRTSDATASKKNGFEFQLIMQSDLIKRNEEVYLTSLENYIGTVGGTLGMAVGFSTFSYITFCLEKLFKVQPQK